MARPETEPGIRKLSTNHLMGEGYWAWLIPLPTGPHSIGIVSDPRFHDFSEMKEVDGAIEWLKKHEPQLGKEVDARRDQIEDFHGIEDFAYSCARVFSPDRWSLVGVSGSLPTRSIRRARTSSPRATRSRLRSSRAISTARTRRRYGG